MIVRTYGRRNRSLIRGSSGGNDNVLSEGSEEPLSQEGPQDICNFAFSSQNSSNWSFDSEPYSSNLSQEQRELSILHSRKHCAESGSEEEEGFGKLKKARNGVFDFPKKVKSVSEVVGTATLMETQECGEMMEHVDEVNFALDGLRKGCQQTRIRRASLLSLLSICDSTQRRRLLRTQGMAKTIVDAVLGLPLDDSPSNLAAATLFYILTRDGQDEYLLDSPTCIHFLMKFLKPLTHDASKNKASTISSKLIGLRKNVDILQDSSKGTDSTYAAIMLKVHEVLVSCKEMKSSDETDNTMMTPKLTPKWIALLTMEKACLSTISLEDTSGTVRKTGGNFKEKLRQLGGLDAIFDVARSCHIVMESCLKKSSFSSQDPKDSADLESLVLVLKCLKIMENATFLSKDNQSHLLEMKGSVNHQGSPGSFTKLIISVIKILSGLSLSRSSCGNSDDENFCNLSNGSCHGSEIPPFAGCVEAVDEIISISSSLSCSSIEGSSSQKSFSISQNSRWLSSAGCSENSKPISETTTSSEAGTFLLKMGSNSSTSSLSTGAPVKENSSRMNSLGKKYKVAEDASFKLVEESQDPFVFQEDEFEPSKWDLLSGVGRVSEAQNRKTDYREKKEGCQSQLLTQQKPSNRENHHSGASCSSSLDEEKSNLLAECLLTAVKVLMNLTNDNPVGCQQISACGGLETLSSLIAAHFPSFNSSPSPFCKTRENTSNLEIDHQNDNRLSDQELDFLVAILGLLVNLVEKDSKNRSVLAAAIVSFPGARGLEDGRPSYVIPLLCSIFLANQGAGEAAEEGRVLALDDDAALLQGEKEAEKMIVEAYAALLLAFLSTESKSIRGDIAKCLPDHNLGILVPVLERFVEFHLTLNMISRETHTTVLEVIESCRVP